jgi:DNA-binding transcriptional ArsR family regulator
MLYFYNMSRRDRDGQDRDDQLFRALADARRREILDLLKTAPRTTGALCDHFAGTLDRCTVLQHIGVLERAGLVIARRQGRVRWNYLDASPVKEIHDRWISPYAVNALALLSRMKREMEQHARDG